MAGSGTTSAGFSSGCIMGLLFVWMGVARLELLVVLDVDNLASYSGEDLYLLLAAFWIDPLTRRLTISRSERDDVPRRSFDETAVYINVSLEAADKLSANTFDKLVELMTLNSIVSAGSPWSERSCWIRSLSRKLFVVDGLC